MNKVLLEIAGLINSQTQTGAYTLVMSDEETGRRLPILIGYAEAQAIAIVIDNMYPPRPLTHDLFKTFADTFGITLTEVIIHNLKEGIFYAKIICTDNNETFEIDARTSDAVALALRFGCPVYTFESILSQAGISIEQAEGKAKSSLVDIQKTSERKKSLSSEFTESTMDELNELLAKAIEDEAYERASQIRDEIRKRGMKS